jgi:hypothetical protein
VPAEEVRVIPEDLMAASARVTFYSGQLAAEHADGDARIESAFPCLPAMGAAALAGKATEWQAATAGFTARLGEHAESLNASGLEYRLADDQAAGDVTSVAGGLTGAGE